jgi:hypothetical protein
MSHGRVGSCIVSVMYFLNGPLMHYIKLFNGPCENIVNIRAKTMIFQSQKFKNLNLQIVNVAFLMNFWFEKRYISSQFHQHFTSSFWANILLPKKFKAKLQFESFVKIIFTKKVHVKYWWNWHEVSISPIFFCASFKLVDPKKRLITWLSFLRIWDLRK